MQTTARVRPRTGKTSTRTAAKSSPRNIAAPPAQQFDLKGLLRTLQAVRDGDFSVRMPSDYEGIEGKVAETLNEIIGANQRLANRCPNCGGELVRRPRRPADRLRKDPASTERVLKPQGCGREPGSRVA